MDERGCWIWTGAKQNSGYGRVWNGEESRMASREAYRSMVGTIPEERQMHHWYCQNKQCCNPLHVEPITMIENVMKPDGAIGKKIRMTHCRRGHPLSGENLKIENSGKRRCMTCQRAKEKARHGKAA